MRKSNESGLLKQNVKEKLDTLLKMKGQKVVYTLAREGVKTRLNQLGELIGQLLVLFFKEGSDEYKTLKKVFEQQFEVDKSRYYHLWKNRGVLN